MKKYIYNIYLLAALFLTATACTKEDSVLDSSAVEKEQSDNKTYTMTVIASKGEDVATTRALSLDGTTLNSTWEVDDEVTVYNVTKGADLGGTLNAQSSGTTTKLSGTLTGTIEPNDKLTLKFRSPNYASQNGTLQYIAANCDYATASVTVSTVDGGNVTTTAAAHFANQQAIVKFTLLDKGNSDAPLDETTKLAITVGSNSYTIIPASETNVLFVAIPGISAQSITLNAIVGSKIYTYTNASATFANSQYYTVRVKMTQQNTIGIGKLIAQNGCIYDNPSYVPSSTEAVGIIAYVGNKSNCQNGLAVALDDESGTMNYSNAVSTASGHTIVPGGIWRLPSKADWEHMTSYLIANHQRLTSGSYWTSTDSSPGSVYCATITFTDNENSIDVSQQQYKQEDLKARAVLAF